MDKKELAVELEKFFMWFRENGERWIDLSIEDMIQQYINERCV